MNYYAGYEVIEDKYMTETVRRTWKERLLTIPWNPLITFKEIPLSYMAFYEDKIIMHPDKYLFLKKTLPHLIKET